MMRMARTRRSGGANGALGARGNLGQQNQRAHGFEFETYFHVASCNTQVFGIKERLHATFLKDRPVHHEQGWHEDDEDSDAIRLD